MKVDIDRRGRDVSLGGTMKIERDGSIAKIVTSVSQSGFIELPSIVENLDDTTR